MIATNDNGIPLIVEAIIFQGPQYPKGFMSIEGYKEIELYYASIGNYQKAKLYRDHQIKPIKNTITKQSKK